MPETILTTGRLRVEPFEETDLPLLLQHHSDPEVNRFHSTGPRPMDAEEAQMRLATFIEGHRTSGLSKWKLLTREGEFIGRAGVAWVTDPDGYELGYSLKRDACGKGYATEIARALTRWFFENTENRFLICYAHSANKASQRVMVKTGFSYWFDMEKNGAPSTFYRIERSDVV